MKLSLLSMLGLTSSLFVFAACGQVQETTTPAPKATSSTVTPPPVPTTPPTTTATTKPEDPPPPPFEKISFPQAQTHGGKVIKTPKVLPVLFAGDPMIGKIGDFHSQLATSTYWKTIASEYGIGDITPLAPVILEEAPPTQATDDDVKAWLTNKLQNDTVLGAADSDTLYALYYPSGTTIMLDGQRSCRSFGGYHNEGVAGETPVAYAVMPRCQGGGGMNPTDVLTITASHEVFEWATDPFPFSDPAYQSMARGFEPWEWAFLGELGDLCTGLDWDRGLKPADLGYRVQRMWSNKSAAAGHNPCIPVPDTSYFVGVPMAKTTVNVQGASTKGVSFKAGESIDLPIQFYSDNPSDPAWEIQVVDSSQILGQSVGNGNIEFALKKSTGKHGDVTTVTISSKTPDYSLFLVVASRGDQVHMWPSFAVAK